ncbi:MAG: hypothetical protein J6X07_08815 [Prevotella sp.]|nr:hypothetical protein [Prevotella sp.]
MKEKTNPETPFNFGIGNSPVVKQTEQKLVEGYQRIESEEQSGGEAESAKETAAAPQTAQPEEETKGIQAYIPMSLYERLVMRKLKTKEPLGSMFLQAIRLWIDVQEGKMKVEKLP